MVKYIGFYVDHRSYYLWPPVIVEVCSVPFLPIARTGSREHSPVFAITRHSGTINTSYSDLGPGYSGTRVLGYLV